MKPRLIPIILLALLVAPSHGADPPPAAAARFEEARTVLKRPDVTPVAAKRAFRLMKESADAGHVPAMAGLAYLYETGTGTKKSHVSAMEWYRRAAENDHVISQFNLANLLVSRGQQPGEESAAIHKRFAEGVEWYRRAADQGLTRARSSYGIILMRGDYQTTADPTKAAPYLSKAADDGDFEAMNALALMFQSGNGVSRDLATTEALLRKAAQGGHVKARANLGEFLDPNSTDRNRRIEAIAWLMLAEQEQDPVAKRVLSIKSQAVSPVDMKAARAKADELQREFIAKPTP